MDKNDLERIIDFIYVSAMTFISMRIAPNIYVLISFIVFGLFVYYQAYGYYIGWKNNKENLKEQKEEKPLDTSDEEDFKRGHLTNRLKSISLEFLGRIPNKDEISLFIYLNDRIINSGRIDPKVINEREVYYLERLQAQGHIFSGEDYYTTDNPFASTDEIKFFMTKDFFFYVSQIAYYAYAENKLSEDMKKALNYAGLYELGVENGY